MDKSTRGAEGHALYLAAQAGNDDFLMIQRSGVSIEGQHGIAGVSLAICGRAGYRGFHHNAGR